MAEPLVLAVDDEASILTIVRLALQSAGFRVITARTGAEALRLDSEQAPDVIVLDLLLPDMNGLEVLDAVTARRKVPVVLLTGDVTQSRQRVSAKAFDYLVKPFSPDDLAEAVRDAARSGGESPGRWMPAAGDVRIQPQRGLAVRGGDIIPLSDTERALLKELARSPGTPVTAEALLDAVWGEEYRGDAAYLELWIARLRLKMEADAENPQLILDAEGGGYLLAARPLGRS